MEKNINCKLIIAKSIKSGKDYARLDIELTPDYKKTVFLDFSEQALVKLAYNNNDGKE